MLIKELNETAKEAMLEVCRQQAAASTSKAHAALEAFKRKRSSTPGADDMDLAKCAKVLANYAMVLGSESPLGSACLLASKAYQPGGPPLPADASLAGKELLQPLLEWFVRLYNSVPREGGTDKVSSSMGLKSFGLTPLTYANKALPLFDAYFSEFLG